MDILFQRPEIHAYNVLVFQDAQFAKVCPMVEVLANNAKQGFSFKIMYAAHVLLHAHNVKE